MIETAVCHNFYECGYGIIHRFTECLPEISLIGHAHEVEVVELGGVFKVEVVGGEEQVGEGRLELGDGEPPENAAAVVVEDDECSRRKL